MTITDVRRRNLQALVTSRFGGVQSRFGLAIGRQSDYVSRLVTGKKALGDRLAREIEATLNLERGELDRPSIVDDGVQPAVNSYLLGRTVPIITWENLVQFDHDQTRSMAAKIAAAATDYAPRPSGASESTYALIVRGPAMEPEFRDGWLIYVDETPAVKHGDFVVARPGGHVMPILRQLVVDGDATLLRAVNPSYPDGLTPLGDGKILGKVVYQARAY